MQHTKLDFSNHITFILSLNSSYKVKTKNWRPGSQKANMADASSRLIPRNVELKGSKTSISLLLHSFSLESNSSGQLPLPTH